MAPVLGAAIAIYAAAGQASEASLPRPLVATEVFSVGGDRPGDENFFGSIIDIARTDDGTSYFLDSQLHRVVRYSAKGDPLNTFGREGEVPGEFQRPGSIEAMPSGRWSCSSRTSSECTTLPGWGSSCKRGGSISMRAGVGPWGSSTGGASIDGQPGPGEGLPVEPLPLEVVVYSLSGTSN